METARKEIRTASPAVTAELFGAADMNMRCVESAFGVTVHTPGAKSMADGDNTLVITGDIPECVNMAEKTLNILAAMAQKNGTLTEQNVLYVISMVRDG